MNPYDDELNAHVPWEVRFGAVPKPQTLEEQSIEPPSPAEPVALEAPPDNVPRVAHDALKPMPEKSIVASSLSRDELSRALAADKRSQNEEDVRNLLYAAFARKTPQLRSIGTPQADAQRSREAKSLQERQLGLSELRALLAIQKDQPTPLEDEKKRLEVENLRSLIDDRNKPKEWKPEKPMDYLTAAEQASYAAMGVQLPKDEAGRTRKDLVPGVTSFASAKEGRQQAQAQFGTRLSEERKEKAAAETRRIEGMEIPGWKRKEGVRLDDAEVRRLRDASTEAVALNSSIDSLAKAIERNGIELNPRHPAYGDMQARLADLQLTMKGPALYQLGVLAGPDMAILNTLTGDPTSLRGAFKGTADALARLKVAKERAQAKLDAKMSGGYERQKKSRTRTITNSKTGESFPGITEEQWAELRKEPDAGDYTFTYDEGGGP